MGIWKREDNWLLGIGKSDHTNHTITGGAGALSVDMVQQTFDKTYGKGKFNVKSHGDVITVFSMIAMIQKIKGTISSAQTRGDQKAVDRFTEMLKKYENEIQ
jgi:formylmethanofuran dehydrogenase subunit E